MRTAEAIGAEGLWRAAVQEGRSTDAENRAVPLAGQATQDAIRAAATAEALHAAIGVDSWAVVPIASARRPGRALEGTRLTLVRPSLRVQGAVAPPTSAWTLRGARGKRMAPCARPGGHAPDAGRACAPPLLSVTSADPPCTGVSTASCLRSPPVAGR